MKVIIPAAGEGTRLRPHTHTLPKALLFVAGKPILAHIIDDIIPLRPSQVIVIVGYKGDLVEEYVRENYAGLNLEFVHQSERRGIGHAVAACADHADSDEPLLIILGDTIIRTDLAGITSCAHNALGVKEVNDPRRFGVCEVSGERITHLVEKPEDPPSNLALVGLYFLRDARELFRAVRHIIENDLATRGEYQITDALERMIQQGAKFEPFVIGDWFDCGKPEAMLETNRKLLEDQVQRPAPEGSVVIAPVSIARGATVESSIIGPWVSLDVGAVVRHSIVRDSIVSAGACVTDSVLEQSLVGVNAVVSGAFHRIDVGDSSEIHLK